MRHVTLPPLLPVCSTCGGRGGGDWRAGERGDSPPHRATIERPPSARPARQKKGPHVECRSTSWRSGRQCNQQLQGGAKKTRGPFLGGISVWCRHGCRLSMRPALARLQPPGMDIDDACTAKRMCTWYWSRRCGIAGSPAPGRPDMRDSSSRVTSQSVRESQAGREGRAGSQPASQPVSQPASQSTGAVSQSASQVRYRAQLSLQKIVLSLPPVVRTLPSP